MLVEADANLIVLKWEKNFIEFCAWLQKTVLIIACPNQAGRWKSYPVLNEATDFSVDF